MWILETSIRWFGHVFLYLTMHNKGYQLLTVKAQIIFQSQSHSKKTSMLVVCNLLDTLSLSIYICYRCMKFRVQIHHSLQLNWIIVILEGKDVMWPLTLIMVQSLSHSKIFNIWFFVIYWIVYPLASKYVTVAWNLQSSNPPFTSVELDHSDSGREGCTVTTLTITAEPKNWQNAIRVAVHEVCFLCCASPVFVMVQFFFSFHCLFQLVILCSTLLIPQLLVSLLSLILKDIKLLEFKTMIWWCSMVIITNFYSYNCPLNSFGCKCIEKTKLFWV